MRKGITWKAMGKKVYTKRFKEKINWNRSSMWRILWWECRTDPPTYKLRHFICKKSGLRLLDTHFICSAKQTCSARALLKFDKKWASGLPLRRLSVQTLKWRTHRRTSCSRGSYSRDQREDQSRVERKVDVSFPTVSSFSGLLSGLQRDPGKHHPRHATLLFSGLSCVHGWMMHSSLSRLLKLTFLL